jgi:hypothetical protein
MCVKIIAALIIATHPKPPGNVYKVKEIAKNICYYSEKRSLDPYNVLSIIRHESGFNIRSRSNTGDYGLMQINARIHNIKCNLLKIKCNIREGTRILLRMKNLCLSNHIHSKYTNTHPKYIHWLRHYNWHSKSHHLRILWLIQAYKRNSPSLNRMIRRRGYTRLKITYGCITDLCGAVTGE